MKICGGGLAIVALIRFVCWQVNKSCSGCDVQISGFTAYNARASLKQE